MQVFFSFLGFETVASAAEETRNPPVDLPIGIIAALAACAGLYALMCVTIVGMVPWQQIDIDTPFMQRHRVDMGRESCGYRGTRRNRYLAADEPVRVDQAPDVPWAGADASGTGGMLRCTHVFQVLCAFET